MYVSMDIINGLYVEGDGLRGLLATSGMSVIRSAGGDLAINIHKNNVSEYVEFGNQSNTCFGRLSNCKHGITR